MPTVITDDVTVHIPDWVVDLASFGRWAESDEFPEEGRVSFIDGDVWVDMSLEQVFSHVKVKTLFTRVVGNIVADAELGECLGDGVRVVNEAGDVSNVPDALVILAETFRAGRVQLVEGKEGGFTSVRGSPDIVLEVVSHSSVDKDCDWLMTAYYDAGVREYWLVDARGKSLRFDIYRAGPKGFVAGRKSDGWVKSPVLGKSFRFAARPNPLGHPDYVLEVR